MNPRLLIQHVNDDWIRVFVDGKLVAENHSIRVGGSSEFVAIMEALGIQVFREEVTE